jgi:type II secretory pathway predicted ATPase ExeA
LESNKPSLQRTQGDSLNNAATAALMAAAAAGKDLVDDACAKQAAAEITKD